MKITHLSLSWSVSRGKETYGYNICRLDDLQKGERFKCMGGGYDMLGTVFASWLVANYADRLLALKDRAHYILPVGAAPRSNPREDSFYGLTYIEADDRVNIDGACGIDCVQKIAREIGLEIEREYITKGRRRGDTIGWFISEKEE